MEASVDRAYRSLKMEDVAQHDTNTCVLPGLNGLDGHPPNPPAEDTSGHCVTDWKIQNRDLRWQVGRPNP